MRSSNSSNGCHFVIFLIYCSLRCLCTDAQLKLLSLTRPSPSSQHHVTKRKCARAQTIQSAFFRMDNFSVCLAEKSTGLCTEAASVSQSALAGFDTFITAVCSLNTSKKTLVIVLCETSYSRAQWDSFLHSHRSSTQACHHQH